MPYVLGTPVEEGQTAWVKLSGMLCPEISVMLKVVVATLHGVPKAFFSVTNSFQEVLAVVLDELPDVSFVSHRGAEDTVCTVGTETIWVVVVVAVGFIILMI